MAKTDYTKLDELIAAAVRGGAKSFMFIRNHTVRVESERLARSLNRDAYRIIDGRLQALRRRGALAWTPKAGWRIPDRDNSATVRAVASEFSRSGSSQASPSLTVETVAELRRNGMLSLHVDPYDMADMLAEQAEHIALLERNAQHAIDSLAEASARIAELKAEVACLLRINQNDAALHQQQAAELLRQIDGAA